MNRIGLILFLALGIVMGAWAKGGNEQTKAVLNEWLKIAQQRSEAEQARDQAQLDRDKAVQDRDEAERERRQAQQDRNEAMVARDDALAKERKARLVPITREIIAQVKGNVGGLEALGYYISMQVTLVLDTPDTKLKINENGEATYQERNSSQSVIIEPTSQGELKNVSGIDGEVFKVRFSSVSGEQIDLDFRIDPATNRYDLVNAVTYRGKNYQMHLDEGVGPHLLIYYNAKFEGKVVTKGFNNTSSAPEATVSSPPDNPPTPDYKVYRVQVGAFREQKNIDQATEGLRNMGFHPGTEPVGNLTRVIIITGLRTEDISGVKKKIMTLGYGMPLVREE
jgi:hypothetical protein